MLSKRFSPRTNKGRAIAELQAAVAMQDTVGYYTESGIALPDMTGNLKLYYSGNPYSGMQMWFGPRLNALAADTLGFDPRIARVVDFYVDNMADGTLDHNLFRGYAAPGGLNLDFSHMRMLSHDVASLVRVQSDLLYAPGTSITIPGHGIPDYGGNARVILGTPGYLESGGVTNPLISSYASWVDEDTLEINVAAASIDALIAAGGGAEVRMFFCSPLIHANGKAPVENLSTKRLYVSMEFALDYDVVRPFLISDD